jgi:RNA polymerase sigma-70 factor, ECF subfamily
VIQSKLSYGQPPAPSLRLVDGCGERAAGRKTAPSDAELVHALLAEDAGAPVILWDRFAPLVRRLLLRALGPCLEIDDLAQEVFLRIFMRLSALRDPSALRPFVVSVVANVLKWELRRRWIGRRVLLSPTGTLPDIASTSEDAEARQALRRCYLVFEKLETKERVAFVFRYLEGMTIKEVAAALDVSVSTAKRWVGRAASKVAEHVSQDADLRSFFVDSWKEGQHDPGAL